MEIDLIFRRSWIYIGHVSQVPSAGDYVTATLLGQPVVVVRQEKGDIRVLHNRCPHRGARVVAGKAGTAKRFSCMYHGWTFRNDGSLLAIPCRDNYAGTEVANNSGQFGMSPVRSAEYRGFIFVNLSDTGPDLETFLGDARRALDNMTDRSPDSELEVAGGRYRAVYDNNWKIYLENLHDGMHPPFVHGSSVDASRQVAANNSAGVDHFRLNVIQANGQSLEDMKELEVSCYAHGHSDMRGFRNPDDEDDPMLQAYWSAHAEKHGEQASAEILNTNLHNVSLYPATSAHPRFLQVRVITPLAVNQTAIDIQVLRWKGAPEELHHRNIQYANTVHSLSSMIKPDDLEAYQRIQEGLASSGDSSVSQHSKFTDGDNDRAPDSALSERYIRNQYRAWLEYMCGDAA
jgi:phenylpropionate dioxygenase-like ring-hydroxylating dioxygenase large terminal subunit